MHKLSEEAFELDLMKSCQEELGFELFDATSEVIGGDSSTFGRQTTQEVLLSKNLRNALVKLNPNLPQEAIDNAFYFINQDLSVKTAVDANTHELPQEVTARWVKTLLPTSELSVMFL